MKIFKIAISCVLLLCFFLFFSQMCDTDSKNLGSGFVYNAEHKHILGKIDIPPTIISYAYDERFIVAKQKPKEFNEAIYDKMEYVYPLGRDTVYYWLIIKQEQKVFGALDYDSFQKLTKEYKVPNKLIQRTTALNSTDSYDTYKVRGDANGIQMFEFMSQNTTVEWSQAQTGIAGDKGLSFLTTSHDAATERGMSNLFGRQLYAGYTIRELNHNHPSNTPYPSGLSDGTGDIGFSRMVTNNRQTNRLNVPIFQIYLPSSKSYINYNPNSVRSAYGR